MFKRVIVRSRRQPSSCADAPGGCDILLYKDVGKTPMFKLGKLLAPKDGGKRHDPAPVPPLALRLDDGAEFPFAQHLVSSNGMAFANWAAIRNWTDHLAPEARRKEAWVACERAWLLHARECLGERYRFAESPHSMLVSSLEPNVERATLDFMGRTLHRVVSVLEGIADKPMLGKDLLIVFDSLEEYYDYVAHYYPEEGEFASSGGMYINAGCGHFVTVKADLWAIEPVIAHELTHSCLSHLPIPAWLNEGLAVNTELRLTLHNAPPLFTAQEMHRKHQRFWEPPQIQEFWSGKSFLRADDGCMLSYDLARIMVEQMSKDWPSFRAFVRSADLADSGADAAQEHLGCSLGDYVSALLQAEPTQEWAPDPERWNLGTERGAF